MDNSKEKVLNLVRYLNYNELSELLEEKIRRLIRNHAAEEEIQRYRGLRDKAKAQLTSCNKEECIETLKWIISQGLKTA